MPHTVRIKVEKSNNGVSAKGGAKATAEKPQTRLWSRRSASASPLHHQHRAGNEKQWCDIASVSGQAWWYKPVVVVRWRCESNVAVCLLYLEYSDEVARYYPKVNLPNLVEAVLDLNIRDLDYMKLYRERNDDGLRNYVVLRCGNLCKLMTRIGNLFSICFESMPTFNNLKMLRISGSVHPVGWQAMPVLLQNCPHLETLQMEYLCVWDCISLEEKGGWLISCPVEKIVEKILIEMFRGTKGAIGTVKHLLESLSCLKEITLFAGRDYPTDIFDLVVKMVNLCNGSYRTELW
ncbi:BnaC08g09670D [Brassica napus]|uniref:BnaC08g09670D protein n=1 Tax=Brassica napus TaxID=3708 RepID=A0A078HER2_BRANA|nr:BnaC08g09670D [Brassica napus]